MITSTYLGPSDDKYAEGVRPYYVILDLFDTVHAVFNCDLVSIITSYVPDLRKAPRIYTPAADCAYEDISINYIMRDLCIDLPSSRSTAGARYDIIIGDVGAHTVYIRCTDTGDIIRLGGTSYDDTNYDDANYQNVYTSTNNTHTRVTSFGATVWLVQAKTPGNWTGTLITT